jgi:hypothetical protein
MDLQFERRGARGERMTFVSMQHIPLNNAYLCQDCNSVGNCAVQCPACASEALLGLATILNRRVEERVQSSFIRPPALAA